MRVSAREGLGLPPVDCVLVAPRWALTSAGVQSGSS